MSFFFESPVYLGICGLLVVIIAGVAWANTANKYALWTAGGAIIVTAILLLVEHNVVTYREEIVNRLNEVADHLQNNRYDEAISAIHPAAENSIQMAKAELPNYDFREARVTTIHSIDIDGQTKKPRAVAEFNVVVALTVNGQSFDRIPRFIRVTLYRENDKWYVFDYSHSDPFEGFRNRKPQ
jgi:hypothetical protein